MKYCYIITSVDSLNPARYCFTGAGMGALEKLAGHIMKARINVVGD